MTEVRQLVAAHPDQTDLGKELAYLEKREALMQYPKFQDAGWPIGDGAVESANKLVVEARLKGGGMHWAQDHVDPMLALRNIACNDRWNEAWPQIVGLLRPQEQQRRAKRRHQRQRLAIQPSVIPAEAAIPLSVGEKTSTEIQPPLAKSKPRQQTAPDEPRRPAANHPWRRMPVGRARFRPTKQPDAKP